MLSFMRKVIRWLSALISFFKSRKIRKLLKSMPDEEIFEILRLTVMKSALYGRIKEASELLTVIILEISLRPNCEERLFKELSDLCLDGFMDPVSILIQFFILKILQDKSLMLDIKEKIANNNFKNWIKYTYSTNFDPEISSMISEKDIDDIEKVLTNIITG